MVNNEGLELNACRIQMVKLDELVDSFISSCFVHLRKPDADIFQRALDIAQALEKASVGITDVLPLLGNDHPHQTPRNKVADWLLEKLMHDLGQVDELFVSLEAKDFTQQGRQNANDPR